MLQFLSFDRKSASKQRTRFVTLILFLVLLPLYGGVNAAIQNEEDELLQLVNAGHVLGFKADGIYVTNGQHLLQVNFLKTFGVEPNAADSRTGERRTQPLSRVTYADLWPGISLRYEAPSRGIVESIWIIAAGADPRQIRLRYNTFLMIEKNGSLKIDYDEGWMSESIPIAWQNIDGSRHPVEVAFRMDKSSADESIIGFEVGQYDRTHPIFIDPTLQWNTFMGSSNPDEAHSIAVDDSGYIYVAGISWATTWGSPINDHAGGYDAFVAKLDGAGIRQWNTFMGSSGNDYVDSIVVDGSGNIYVAGNSSSTWSTPVRPFTGSVDAFVAKLNGAGVRQWNTFLGSSTADFAHGIKADGSGNVYVVGESYSPWGLPMNPHTNKHDVFVVKLNTNGTLVWNTFFGSTGYDYGQAIDLDGGNNIYLVGYGDTTWGSPIAPHSGGNDTFAAKLNNSGFLQWITFMGSSRKDEGQSIAVDGNGDIYVTGNSDDTWGSPIIPHAVGAGNDVFAARLDNSGTLLWNTFMGSTGEDSGNTIAVDADGNVYVTGLSYLTWGEPIEPHPTGCSAFAAKLNNLGILQWNTFMGSIWEDIGYSIDIDVDSNIFVAGLSYLTWGSPVNPHAGNYDAFVAKLESNTNVIGDINGDGLVTLIDIILSLQVLVNLTPAGINTEGDVNENSKIGFEEILYDLEKVSQD